MRTLRQIVEERKARAKVMRPLDAKITLDIDGETFVATFDIERDVMLIDRHVIVIDRGWHRKKEIITLFETSEWRWLFDYMRACFGNMGLK